MQTFRFVPSTTPYHPQTPILSAFHLLSDTTVVYTFGFIPRTGYAFNTQTHNYTGLMDNLGRLGVIDPKEVEAILALSDYGRKGTAIWRLLSETNWGKIAIRGKYIIAVLRKNRDA